jgi:hypothetical protein
MKHRTAAVEELTRCTAETTMASKFLIITLASVALTACAPAFYPPPAYPPFVYASPAPTYAPPPYAPPPYAPAPIPEAPYGVTPGVAPDAPAGMCDLQGQCYSNGAPKKQVYHGDPTHPDRITSYPPPPITNHPPLVIPPSNDDGAPQ